MIDWVDEDFEQWGKVMRGDVVQLGYSSESLEYKMMKFGPDSLIKDSKVRAANTVYISDGVARTESILLKMCKYDRTLVIVAYTIMASRERQSKIFSGLIGEDISRRQFMIDLDNVQSWYAGYLKAGRKTIDDDLVDSCAQRSV